MNSKWEGNVSSPHPCPSSKPKKYCTRKNILIEQSDSLMQQSMHTIYTFPITRHAHLICATNASFYTEYPLKSIMTQTTFNNSYCKLQLSCCSSFGACPYAYYMFQECINSGMDYWNGLLEWWNGIF